MRKKKPAVIATCKHCGSLFEVIGRSRYGYFCSVACCGLFVKDQKYNRFISGEVNVYSTHRSLRSAVIRRDGHVCSSCKHTHWNGKDIPLELEHKDGDHSNNHPENLCMLCPNCHAQTDTYKSKNKGNGRHARMERYRLGKSY